MALSTAKDPNQINRIFPYYTFLPSTFSIFLCIFRPVKISGPVPYFFVEFIAPSTVKDLHKCLFGLLFCYQFNLPIQNRLHFSFPGSLVYQRRSSLYAFEGIRVRPASAEITFELGVRKAFLHPYPVSPGQFSDFSSRWSQFPARIPRPPPSPEKRQWLSSSLPRLTSL